MSKDIIDRLRMHQANETPEVCLLALVEIKKLREQVSGMLGENRKLRAKLQKEHDENAACGRRIHNQRAEITRLTKAIATPEVWSPDDAARLRDLGAIGW